MFARDGRTRAMISPARCTHQRDVRASVIFVLARWSRQRDSRTHARACDDCDRDDRTMVSPVR